MPQTARRSTLEFVASVRQISTSTGVDIGCLRTKIRSHLMKVEFSTHIALRLSGTSLNMDPALPNPYLWTPTCSLTCSPSSSSCTNKCRTSSGKLPRDKKWGTHNLTLELTFTVMTFKVQTIILRKAKMVMSNRLIRAKMRAQAIRKSCSKAV